MCFLGHARTRDKTETWHVLQLIGAVCNEGLSGATCLIGAFQRGSTCQHSIHSTHCLSTVN